MTICEACQQPAYEGRLCRSCEYQSMVRLVNFAEEALSNKEMRSTEDVKWASSLLALSRILERDYPVESKVTSPPCVETCLLDLVHF